MCNCLRAMITPKTVVEASKGFSCDHRVVEIEMSSKPKYSILMSGIHHWCQHQCSLVMTPFTTSARANGMTGNSSHFKQ
eukprot:246524-Amorphochlora_amoeboformis.AAC.1